MPNKPSFEPLRFSCSFFSFFFWFDSELINGKVHLFVSIKSKSDEFPETNASWAPHPRWRRTVGFGCAFFFLFFPFCRSFFSVADNNRTFCTHFGHSRKRMYETRNHDFIRAIFHAYLSVISELIYYVMATETLRNQQRKEKTAFTTKIIPKWCNNLRVNVRMGIFISYSIIGMQTRSCECSISYSYYARNNLEIINQFCIFFFSLSFLFALSDRTDVSYRTLHFEPKSVAIQIEIVSSIM